jgi:hypothetical protein
MPKNDVKEWAIQEATGKWWGCTGGWGNANDAYRYSYGQALPVVWRSNWNAGYFDKPCDAIRAARKKLEEK